ncbi:MAG: ATP synthase F1 subunit gamma [Bacteroidetes bacterium]|nr:MAG: ATP synthase F1 subunit gamma [Bacteroidota bacterium]
MANLKEVRVRIASIKSTRQITSAMKMVSASKLRKGQNAILNLRPYEEQLRLTLDKINQTLKPEEKNVLCLQKPVKSALVIVVAANKGLCGTFNSNLLKASVNHLRKLKDEGYEIKLWLIGKKAEEFFVRSNFTILETHHDIIDHINFESAFKLARKAMKLIEDDAFQKIDVVYNQFKNPAVYKLITEQFLPIHIPDAPESELSEDDFGYIMEPSRKELLDELIPKVIQTYMYRLLLDSFASEQGARMSAMHKATDNATELLKNLTITYNKVRQANITNEIVEIVGGAEALNR